MADIRINSLPSTATSFNTDDYIAIDGASGGTRKMLASTLPLTDVTLGGASGPSVKSTLSARAPRQGLVFDGTAGATVSGVPAFGTNPFSYVVFIRPNQMPSVASAIIRGAANSADLGYLTNGTIQLNKADVSNTLSTPSGQISAGKTACIVYTRDSGTGTFYVNGVSVASGSDSVDYSAATTVIGGTAPTYIHNGFIYALIYNRALSASEVVALYEAGAPSGADYNSAGTERATTNWVNAGTAFTSFSSSGATAFTVTAGASQGRAESRATFALSVGQRVRLTGSVASLSGTADCYLVTSGGTLGSAVTSSAVSANGTFTIEVTATVTDSAMRIALGSAGAWAGTFTSLSLKNTGLLLAPDAAQAGGGLTWYDTSGNAANITLPASGVSWNVPSSRVLGGNWTTSGNLTVSGTGLSSVAGAMKVGGTATFTGAGLELQYVAGGGNYGYFRNYNRTSSVYERLYVDGFLTILNSDSGGNVLIGTTTDGGQKLQVSGTARVSNSISVENNLTLTTTSNPRIYWNSGQTAWIDYTSDAWTFRHGGTGTTSLTLASTGDATFAGKAFINGSFTSGALGVRASTSGTNSIVQVATIEATSTGTPTDGFGGSIDFYNKNLFGTGPTIAGRMAAVFKNTGYSNYEGEVSLWTASNGTLYKQLTLSPGGGAAGTSTFAGPIAINNTVQTAAGVSSTHKVTISIGGTTYYLLATNV